MVSGSVKKTLVDRNVHRDTFPTMSKARAPRAEDLTGRRFGRRVVLGRHPGPPGRARWVVRCDCGVVNVAAGTILRCGRGRSCGCAVFEPRVHGLQHRSGHDPRLQIWASMVRRCTDPKNKAFDRYGGRGIRVCDRWRNSLAAFAEDMGPRPSPKHSLDRIDNDGHYEPSNCRWADSFEQGANKRNNVVIEYGGESHHVAEWGRRLGIGIATLSWRARQGWDAKEVLFGRESTPLKCRARQQSGSQRIK